MGNDRVLTDPDMDATHYGIPVSFIDECAEILMALGHHSDRRTLAAFNRHARLYAQVANLADDRDATAEEWTSDLQRLWAIFRKPAQEDQHPGTEWDWVGEWAEPNTPGAVPVTLLNLA